MACFYGTFGRSGANFTNRLQLALGLKFNTSDGALAKFKSVFAIGPYKETAFMCNVLLQTLILASPIKVERHCLSTRSKKNRHF